MLPDSVSTQPRNFFHLEIFERWIAIDFVLAGEIAGDGGVDGGQFPAQTFRDDALGGSGEGRLHRLKWWKDGGPGIEK